MARLLMVARGYSDQATVGFIEGDGLTAAQ